MQQSYQLESRNAPWKKYRYTIKSNDIWNATYYQVRRSGFRKYRQFEDGNEKILFYIGFKAIHSVDDKETLANVQIDKKLVETVIGNFTLSDLKILDRSYVLKINDNIVAQVKINKHSWHDQFTIEMADIDNEYQAFIFALLVLIDSILQPMSRPVSDAVSLPDHRMPVQITPGFCNMSFPSAPASCDISCCNLGCGPCC
ncbi:unnamed protein product [Adineta ricciae]|uniref:Uncharacterized protein n=1 Tax=Adineta ricciae TaxID=249248 RepID=A0A814S0C7_ADIRI|nr:unnamed protein product [Adineta ricciae]CAF1446195.1 unnamed protein product [Adineta ricciae]